jgi:serine/threonine-protein kinase
MGAVLRGHDPELGRDLAVKVILPAYRSNPDLVRRFVGEARLTGQLQHPGIVPVHDLGQLADGRPFFTMKLIQGRTLAEFLAERPDPGHDLPRFLRYFEVVCQAIGYAHARGVIHRDLKPANIMVGAFGEVQVMDWGLAKRLQEGPEDGPEQTPAFPSPSSSTPLPTDLTRPGAIVGTPDYLAPEQALGRASDRRTDVFGLGAILCEMLTGAPPFRRSDLFDSLQKACEADLGIVADRLDRCGADPQLVRLTKDCLAIDPPGRPADASVVATRLADYLAGVQEQLRRAEVGQARAQARAESERSRRRLAIGLAAAILAVVALGGGTLLLMQHHEAEQSREQARRQQATESARARAADLRHQGRWAEALTVLEQLDQRLDESDGPVRREVEQALVELQLVKRLETIRLGAATGKRGAFARTLADREYEREFRAAGLGGPDELAETVAERIRASAVRAALVAALDAWAAISEDHGRRNWARAVARSADEGGDWSRRLRASWDNPVALEEIARTAPLDRLSPHLLGTLADALGHRGSAVPFLRKAQLQYPGDFWLTFFLARRLHDAKQYAEAAGFYRAALAARPDTPAVLVNLGLVLQLQKKLDEASDCYRRASELDPKDSLPYNNLGNVLWAKNQLGEAIACYRKAVETDRTYAEAHYNLGLALKAGGQPDKAIPCFRKAVELDPKNADAYYVLGNALSARNQLDEAIACWRQAVEIDPKYAKASYNMGNALEAKGQLDDAIASFRKAIAAVPDYAKAHCKLGHALLQRGDFAEALGPLRRGHELGGRRDDWQFASGQWVNDCERLIEREKKLLGILKGTVKPADAAECVAWAQLCVQTRRYVAAARLSEQAFVADGQLANDLAAGHRYRAAAAAVLAGTGKGRDAGNLTNEQRTDLRTQALDWLKADLAARRSYGDASQCARALQNWRADNALAGVRDEPRLAKLPPAERSAWREFWTEVEKVLQPASCERRDGDGKNGTRPLRQVLAPMTVTDRSFSCFRTVVLS